MSPELIFNMHSYKAQAASISTWDSLIGGLVWIAERPSTKAKAAPQQFTIEPDKKTSNVEEDEDCLMCGS